MCKLDYKKVFNVLVEETKKYLLDNNLKVMVLGISGGIDSTVVAAICHEVSKQTGIPLIGRSLPIKNKDDEFDVSELVGQVFCDDFKVVNLLSMYQHVNQSVYDGEGTLGTPISKGNIQARLRMIYLYNLASIHRGLVMSTDNQTEYQLGFWTIHGDVGDFDPIQGLWKTEVYELAKWLIGYYYGCGIKKEVDADGARKICDMCEAIKKSMSLTPTDGINIYGAQITPDLVFSGIARTKGNIFKIQDSEPVLQTFGKLYIDSAAKVIPGVTKIADKMDELGINYELEETPKSTNSYFY